MKKVINLIPPSVKAARNIKKAKKSIVYVVLACGGSYFGFNQYDNYVQKQIGDFQKEINDYKSQQSQVKDLKQKIDKAIAQKNSISSSSFPYHRFLYFITVNAPQDVRILSVQSVNPNSETNTETQDSSQSNNGTQTAGGQTQTQAQGQPQGQTQGQTQAQAQPQNQSAQPSNNTQSSASTGASGQANTSQKNPDGTVSPAPAQSTSSTKGTSVAPANITNKNSNQQTQDSESQSPFNFGTSEIYVRGYTIYPDSIAILANKMKQEDYVASVTVTKVRDYYTGLQNFKLFEMKITYQ